MGQCVSKEEETLRERQSLLYVQPRPNAAHPPYRHPVHGPNIPNSSHRSSQARTSLHSPVDFLDQTWETGATPGSSFTGGFRFLDRKYVIETPSCLVPRLNELFKSVCERYDIAVVNREKVDETLTHFKRVLEVDMYASLTECFRVWKSHLTNPQFVVTYKESSGDVKQITVRAEEVPKTKRKAQKHIRDLLDACHLFVDQKDFLRRQITSDIIEIDRLCADLQNVSRDAQLSSSERKQLPRSVKSARAQFVQFPAVLDQFYGEIHGLVQEINDSVYVLQES